MMENFKQNIKTIIFILIANLILFIFLEGLLSTVIVIKDVMSPVELVIERYHSTFDELLGWINIPNLEIKDYYGPGADLKINSQCFRSDKEFDIEKPKGKIRVICSGDSFTFGQGVGNKNTWCEQFTLIDNQFEGINLGQIGYGIDQAYLWYMRDGKKFEHDIHIFAFITDDIQRMRVDTRQNYSKPILKLVNGNLEVKNVPLQLKIPRHSASYFKLIEHLQKLSEFRFYEFFKRITKKVISQKTIKMNLESENEIKPVLLKVLESLHKINREKGSTLVVVYLPQYEDGKDEREDTNLWKQWLKIEMAKRDILFIDLVDEFRKLSSDELKSFYLEQDCHFSKRGNKFVSEILYKKLLSVNEVSKHLPKVGSYHNK